VLAAVPGSRLLLKAAGLACPATRARITGFFSTHGVDPVRLDLRAWTHGYSGHLETFHEIDIALDCFPYPGITTSLEALHMGVPVVTRSGDRFVARFGEMILHAIGHPEWIAQNEDRYVTVAAALASDISSRQALRQRLRDDLLASPLCNPRAFTAALEEALRTAWRRWCAQPQPPGV
jgi:predicted O-linked N-acetylglucosamine transferase (SPINDLY family)